MTSLAARAEISQSRLSQIERGRLMPSIDEAARLAVALGVPLEFRVLLVEPYS